MLKAFAVALFVLTPATSGYVSIQHHRPPAEMIELSGSHAGNVALIGDSLSWQAKSSIEISLSEANMMARISVNPGHALSSPWAQNTLEEDMEGDTFGVIVLETASNDAIQVERNVVPVAQYSRLLNQVITRAKDRCVVIMNAKVRAWYYQPSAARAINDVITVAAETHSNVRIVDWNLEALQHPSWFGPDLLHLYPGLPATILASDSPSAASQDVAERGFAQALQVGIDSCGGLTRA
jgi:hypothetical protein